MEWSGLPLSEMSSSPCNLPYPNPKRQVDTVVFVLAYPNTADVPHIRDRFLTPLRRKLAELEIGFVPVLTNLNHCEFPVSSCQGQMEGDFDFGIGELVVLERYKYGLPAFLDFQNSFLKETYEKTMVFIEAEGFVKLVKEVKKKGVASLKKRPFLGSEGSFWSYLSWVAVLVAFVRCWQRHGEIIRGLVSFYSFVRKFHINTKE